MPRAPSVTGGRCGGEDRRSSRAAKAPQDGQLPAAGAAVESDHQGHDQQGKTSEEDRRQQGGLPQGTGGRGEVVPAVLLPAEFPALGAEERAIVPEKAVPLLHGPQHHRRPTVVEEVQPVVCLRHDALRQIDLAAPALPRPGLAQVMDDAHHGELQPGRGESGKGRPLQVRADGAAGIPKVPDPQGEPVAHRQPRRSGQFRPDDADGRCLRIVQGGEIAALHQGKAVIQARHGAHVPGGEEHRGADVR